MRPSEGTLTGPAAGGPLLGALAAHDLVDFSVNAVLRAHGRRGSGLQHFGEGLETRLDRGRIETRHLRTSPLGAAAPAAGPVPGPAPGRLVRFPKMDAKIPPSPPCPPPAGPGAADGGCPGPIGLRPPPNIWPRM